MPDYACSEEILPKICGAETGCADVSQKPLLSTQQQRVLMSLVGAGNHDFKQRVISHNLRLVVNVARRYEDHGVALLDLVSEGIIGFIHALENFGREGGFRFSPYATQCVRRNIVRAIMAHKSRHLLQ